MNIRLILGALLGAALLSARGEAAVKYTVTDLGTLGGTQSDAYDVNNAGQVVGYLLIPGGIQHAFLWQDGTMRDLGTLGGENSNAYAINDSGQVVGTADRSAFLWQEGVMTLLGELPEVPSATPRLVQATGINRYGQVVGSVTVTVSSPAWDSFLIPVVWNNGVATEIFPRSLVFGGPRFGATTDINDHGDVVGVRSSGGFLWRNGALIDLGPALGGSALFGVPSINDVGQVVGFSYLLSGGYQAFLWENGTTTRLALLPGGQGTLASDINNLGQIVGADGSHRAVLWEGGAISDLNDLVPDDSGWTLRSAHAINDLGQIVGWGIINGNDHAFLLTPVPEPATLSLLALGGAALVRRRRT
ncbi:MAG: PEP-CTERM sorting domain-containing protein [Planctomycetota bacterium]|nr:PEP-CTERM sorting domain-containing protein [Planctomycetota bacterium]